MGTRLCLVLALSGCLRAGFEGGDGHHGADPGETGGDPVGSGDPGSGGDPATGGDVDSTDPAHCHDGVTSGDEGAADCGGSCLAACAVGQPCGGDGDCGDGVCAGGHCRFAATCPVSSGPPALFFTDL